MSSHSQPFWCTLCGEGFSAASHLQVSVIRFVELRLFTFAGKPAQSVNLLL